MQNLTRFTKTSKSIDRSKSFNVTFTGKNEARIYKKRVVPKSQMIDNIDKGVVFRSELQIEPPLRNTRGSTPTLIRRSQVLYPVEIEESCDNLSNPSGNDVPVNCPKELRRAVIGKSCPPRSVSSLNRHSVVDGRSCLRENANLKPTSGLCSKDSVANRPSSTHFMPCAKEPIETSFT